MKPTIDIQKLDEGSKSYLLAKAEQGTKPSDAILQAVTREAQRRGFSLPNVLHVSHFQKPGKTTSKKHKT